MELQSKVRVVSFYLLLQCYCEGTSIIDVQPFLAFFKIWRSILLTYLTSQWSFSNSLSKLNLNINYFILWISMSGWQKLDVMLDYKVFQKMFVTKFLFWTSELIFLKENNFRKIQMIFNQFIGRIWHFLRTHHIYGCSQIKYLRSFFSSNLHFLTLLDALL